MQIYRRLFKYIPDYKGLVYLAAGITIISTCLLVVPYYLLYKFMLDLLQYNELGRALATALSILIVMIVQGLLYFAAVLLMHKVGFRLERRMREAGAEQLMRASFAFFDRNESGEIRKKIDDNAQDTHMIVAHLVADQIEAYLLPILLLITMFIVDWRLGVAILILALAGAFLMKLMYGDSEFMSYYMEAMERMNSQSVEFVRGIPVLKIFRTSIDSFKALKESIEEYAKNVYLYSLSCRQPYVIFQVLFMIFPALIVPVGIWAIKSGEPMPEVVAKLLFFAAFCGSIFSSFMRVMYLGMYQLQAQLAVDKLEALFTEMGEQRLPDGEITEIKGSDIVFDNVSFAYNPESPDYILKNLNLHLDANKTYALVGSSGGGKSTLAKLIAGFYPPTSGEIRIGSCPLNDCAEAARMQKIAFVFQHSKLFKTSIYENVLMGRPDASREEVLKALHDASCDSILERFPEAEMTVIGSQGVHLSGGELQRITIARALLKEADIIILDEASAAADPENEYEIQQAFSKLMAGKTVIMIAHRLSSIRRVDEILIVEDGQIIERGSDAELMQKEDSRYRQLQLLYAEANQWRI
ncbi:MAG: ABC transporter ATP-binding protein [Eubacteriales bacterium]|nr:ABC transporter ATP-binding protein [Eubacteriales bacterium]